jgi:hypothetical protein
MTNKYAVTVLQQQEIIDSSARRLVFPHGMVIDNGCSAAFLSVLEVRMYKTWITVGFQKANV